MHKLGFVAIPTLAVMLAAALVCVRAEAVDPEGEPSYQLACAQWPPTQYQCSILAPKDGMAKFATSFRGGVHTMYVSEVLGHCPLLPERAVLMKHIDQGIQVYFATGPEPDHREAPRPDITQELFRGCLPIMVTRWNCAQDGLRFEEIAFVRRIGDRIPIERGDENAAAMLRLSIENPADAARVASVRLCVNGSSNGQPRGLAACSYLSVLRLTGSAVVNAEAKTRFLWRVPEGTVVQPHLRGEPPVILEWTAGSNEPVVRPAAVDEPPFNRYYETRDQENRGAHKAFDNLVRTGWVPDTPLSQGTVGLGLRFPEERLVRQVTIRFADDNWPTFDGVRVEAFDGSDWQSVAYLINGRKPDDLQADPEADKSIGPVWAFAFTEPRQALGLRVMVDRLPPGKDRPEICEFGFSASLDLGPDPQWFDTSSDKLNYIQFQVPVAARGSASIELLVPFLPADGSESKWLETADFARELDATAEWWEAELARGTRVELPEHRVAMAWNTTLQHMFTNAERVHSNGFTITKTNIGWYEAVWASLAAPEIMALDERGYHDDAARCLEPYLAWQGTVHPGGEYKSREGFLTTANEYTWARWVSNHGWLLWALCDHYLLSGDRAWLDSTLPNILAACDWIQREREGTRAVGEDGKRPPHWGLLPAGSTGDGAPDCYGFMGDAVTWRGLEAASRVLETIGHQRAAEIRAAVQEYRQCILDGVDWAARNTPPYVLESGDAIPFIANDVYNVWKINTGLPDPNSNFHGWWLDVGPLYLIDLGVLDPNSELAGHLIRAAEERWMKGNVSNSEPFYMPQRGVYYGRDDVRGYLEMFYTLLAEGMDRQTYVTAEYHHGVQNFVFSDAEFSRTIRQMLVCENKGSIDLAAMVPRAWLEDGKRVSIDGARTYYGTMSFQIKSNASAGTISARVTPPDRAPVPMRLRLRHPRALSIASVTLNGQPHTDFAGEWVNLPAGSKPMEIVASY